MSTAPEPLIRNATAALIVSAADIVIDEKTLTAPTAVTAVQALGPPRRPRSAPSICSRCRLPIVGEPSVVRAISGPLARRFADVSLCLDCSNAFRHWLRAGERAEALRSPWSNEVTP